MLLRPSKIRFSQDSISNRFCDGTLIGEVLDDLCDGDLEISDIPRIDVAKVGGSWYTADNRRLWVFQKLELLGGCNKIEVDEIDEIPDHKMTTDNGGMYVRVRGYPGGYSIRQLESSSSSSSSSESDDDFYDRIRSWRI